MNNKTLNRHETCLFYLQIVNTIFTAISLCVTLIQQQPGKKFFIGIQWNTIWPWLTIFLVICNIFLIVKIVRLQKERQEQTEGFPEINIAKIKKRLETDDNLLKGLSLKKTRDSLLSTSLCGFPHWLFLTLRDCNCLPFLKDVIRFFNNPSQWDKGKINPSVPAITTANEAIQRCCAIKLRSNLLSDRKFQEESVAAYGNLVKYSISEVSPDHEIVRDLKRKAVEDVGNWLSTKNTAPTISNAGLRYLLSVILQESSTKTYTETISGFTKHIWPLNRDEIGKEAWIERMIIILAQPNGIMTQVSRQLELEDLKKFIINGQKQLFSIFDTNFNPAINSKDASNLFRMFADCIKEMHKLKDIESKIWTDNFILKDIQTWLPRTEQQKKLVCNMYNSIYLSCCLIMSHFRSEPFRKPNRYVIECATELSFQDEQLNKLPNCIMRNISKTGCLVTFKGNGDSFKNKKISLATHFNDETKKPHSVVIPEATVVRERPQKYPDDHNLELGVKFEQYQDQDDFHEKLKILKYQKRYTI